MIGTQSQLGAAVGLGIRLVHLPPERFGGWAAVTPRLQRKRELLEGIALTDGSVLFRCHARVIVDPDTGTLSWLGPFCFGATGRRFLYLSWDGFWGGSRQMFRRLQVHLDAIDRAQIEAVQSTPGAWLEATTMATGPDGGPAYADAWLLGKGWVQRADN